MDYQNLGGTDIRVSKICLGTMTWGEQNTIDDAFAQMDYAVDCGINFFDTAEMYPVPPVAKTQGLTEVYIGEWLKQRGKRDDIVLASKATGPGNAHIRSGGPLTREGILQAFDASLERLQTDYLDLYQIHWPNRSTNFFGKLGYSHSEYEGADAEIHDILRTLAELVQQGRVRSIGISNETPWGLMTYLRLADKYNLPKVVSIQNPYSLLNRTFEVGLAEMAIREQVGLLAYSPLAFGMLSGKYRNNQRPEGARLTLFERFNRYNKPESVAATQAYCQLAEQHGLDPAQMALAYINQQPFVTSNIIGATTMDQLKSNIASNELSLSDEVLKGIEAIHQQHPNPAP